MTQDMDHKAYLAGMTPDVRDRLTRRDDAAGLRHLAGHAGLILGLGLLIAAKVPFWWALILPQGIAIAFLFTLEHEATHKTPFENEAMNEWVGWAAGLAIIQPFLWFRYFHMAHHRHTNDPDNDPELAGLPKPGDWPSFWWHLSCIGYMGAKAMLLWTNSFGTPSANYLPARILPRLQREARGMIAIYAAALLFSVLIDPVLLFVWVLPLMFGFPVLRLYLLAEHGRCPTVANMFDNTRTTYTNRIVRFLAWNMPYHTEHHIFPQVPFHRLPGFNAEIRALLRQTSPSYSAFTRDYVAAFET